MIAGSMIKKNPFQLSEGHSQGGKRVIAKVYNQEKTSQEQIERVHHKVQTIHERQ